MRFTLVRPEGIDWEALYIDGKLAVESHSISAWHVLKCLEKKFGCEFKQIEIGDEVAEMGMPALLSELEV